MGFVSKTFLFTSRVIVTLTSEHTLIFSALDPHYIDIKNKFAILNFTLRVVGINICTSSYSLSHCWEVIIKRLLLLKSKHFKPLKVLLRCLLDLRNLLTLSYTD